MCRLIDGGTFTLDLDPIEMLLGVLPLLQLALHAWFAEHLPRLRNVSELESAAMALSFVTGGIFSPRAAFRPFLLVYATTISRGDDFNTDTVMQGISSAVRASLDYGPFDFATRVDTDPALGWPREAACSSATITSGCKPRRRQAPTSTPATPPPSPSAP